jgi:hypothetical protein
LVNFDPGPEADWDSIKKFKKLFQGKVVYFPAAPIPRSGVAPNPWNLKLLDQFRIPSMPENFSMDFAEVTDRRAQEISRICEETNLPLVCQWSGGIDSTLLLSAIIKNFPAHLLSNVRVYMNNSSYLENPLFFERVIKPYGLQYGNFDLDWSTSLVVLGYPADPLWGFADLVEFERQYPGEWRNNPVSKPDRLLAWISGKSSPGLAQWFYELIVHSSQTSGMDLIDYGDFFWWMNFNLNYATQCLHGLGSLSGKITADTFQKYHSNVISWYHTDEYQLWSLSNRDTGVKFDGTVRNYKKAAKDYIFDLDKNPYYRDYKTKMVSNRKGSRTEISVLTALYEDGTAIYTDPRIN